MADKKDNVIDLNKYREGERWGVYSYYWGAAVKDLKNNRWTTIILKPDSQEIDVTDIPVILHDNGIEFLPVINKEH